MGMKRGQLRHNDRVGWKEIRVVRWLCGVSLRERKANDDLRIMLAIEHVLNVIRKGSSRWMDHVLRKDKTTG